MEGAKEHGGALWRQSLDLLREWWPRLRWLLTGSTGAQAVNLLVLPLLTRLYTPQAFADLAVFQLVAALYILGGSGKYHLLIISGRDALERRLGLWAALFVTSISFPVFASLLGGASLWEPARDFLGQDVWGWSLGGWLLLYALLTVLNIVLEHYLEGRERFWSVGLGRWLRAVLFALAAWWLGRVGEPQGMILATAWAQAVQFGWYWLGFLFLFRWEPFQWRQLWIVLRDNLDYPRYQAGNSLLFALADNLFVLLIRGFYGPVVQGWFALSDKVLRLPGTLVGKPLAEIFFKTGADLLAEDRGRFRRHVFRYGGALAVLGLLPAALMAAFGPFLFELVFGAEWRIAGRYAQLLALWGFLWFVVASLRQLPVLLGAQRHHFQLELGLAAMTLLVFAVAGGLKCSLEWALGIKVLAESLGFCLLLGWMLRKTREVERGRRT